MSPQAMLASRESTGAIFSSFPLLAMSRDCPDGLRNASSQTHHPRGKKWGEVGPPGPGDTKPYPDPKPPSKRSSSNLKSHSRCIGGNAYARRERNMTRDAGGIGMGQEASSNTRTAMNHPRNECEPKI
ncbi:hypothetical protein BKA61DRAFT_580768 [Leptodontidium sp. MPI-SDFR-AT-0119]|nr:hypothetical protein BKA61DRAFT_580768 [Leptodontidium sp. MPI-SDFR-AT-0119]